MTSHRDHHHVRKLSSVLAGAALLTGGVAGLSLGTVGLAGADGPSTVCGPSTTLTPNTTSAVPPATTPAVTPQSLTVPQYNGSDLTGVQLSLKFTHTFGPEVFQLGGATYSEAASGDNVLVEMSGPGLPALGSYVDTAPTSNAGFTVTGTTFTAGDPAPALPAGLVASSDSDAIAVDTGAGPGQIDPSWNTLGFGPAQTVAAPWPAPPTTVVAADDSAALNANEQTQSVTDLTDYEGTGTVSLSAAYFNAGLHSFGSGSNAFFGSNEAMSVQACATYTVLGAQTPEVPSTLLLPASAAAVGLGAYLVVRRRRLKVS